ncbi:anti-sigma factor [Acuticoccus mangrovi]|uniref:Anti-sigma factor n=1 Tax=Acuticoccus mangrovi TaxID=2796142 RepID=A0A934IMB4_9HYPH|nr:anti-sigma factor [Acuticoccus mangrovi]MBJ3775056.1 anti-sigma factor [Acuticoccus mangrovi]
MSLEDPHADESLEYVLALMESEDRRAFEVALLDDPELAAEVWHWEERLVPLAEAVRPRAPSRGVYRRIERQLFGADARLRRRMARWRGIAGLFGTLAVALCLALVVLLARPELMIAPSPQWMAGIVGEDGSVVLARLRPDGTLAAAPYPDAAADESAELWVVPAAGEPVSLGVFEAGEETAFTISDAARRLFADEARLVITLEPRGGSPTGQPTGPAVATGDLRRI